MRRDSKLHKEWITAVLERDDYLCKWCHKKDDLVTHHIKCWEDFPDLRFDVSNGLTLCRPCHMSHHKNHKGKTQIPWNKGLKTGVGGPKGKEFTEQHKLKLRIQKLGKSSWNKGVPMSDETKVKQRLIHKGKKWIINPETGKRMWVD